jgi:diguanylate cyclase (GGDEF)-like protein
MPEPTHSEQKPALPVLEHPRRHPSLAVVAVVAAVLVALLIGGLTAMLGGTLWRIVAVAENAERNVVPRAILQHQHALMTQQLARAAEVILYAGGRKVRAEALAEAESVALRFAAVVDTEMLKRLDNALHAVRRWAYRADLMDALRETIEDNLRHLDAMTMPLDAATENGWRLQVFDLRHLLREAARTDDPERLEELRLRFDAGLATLREQTAAGQVADPDDLAPLAIVFDLRREIITVRREAAGEGSAIHAQLSELTAALSADAAALAARSAGDIVDYGRNGLVASGLGAAGFLILLGVVGIVLRRHVVAPALQAAEALETVQRERRPVSPPPTWLREFDAIRHSIERFGQALVDLQDMALHDSLTGLANRRMFFDRLGHALALAKRAGSRGALLYFDLDGFKDVNDALGHDSGDQLLAETALRMTSRVRESDMVSRVGGDEFTVIIENLAQTADAEVTAGKIRDALRTPFDLGGRRVVIDGSVGIAFFPASPADSPHAVVRRADRAMYAAKLAGKGRACIYSAELEGGPAA